jgi:DNA adenine methylase
MVVARTEARPFLKWAGGKTQLVPRLARFHPDSFERYFEPFLGSGAVFFDLWRSRQGFKAYLSDGNEELIDAYKVVRDDLPALTRVLEGHKRSHQKGGRDYYYHVRDNLNGRLTAVQRAARFIYLNKTCYNGLYRVNASGLFNVPAGDYKDPPICDRQLLQAASNALRASKLSVGDFEDAVRGARAGDFIYFDPPYVPLSSTSNFTGYTHSGFGEREQQRLAECFRALDRRGCHVMLSNSASPLVNKLYRGYRIESVQARRAINSNGKRRGKIDELVVVNYA